jgi:(p)ppGpp synthase/HD superfamily hydrolase
MEVKLYRDQGLTNIFSKITTRLTVSFCELIDAEQAHRGNASGEPYINHCVAVAIILAEMRSSKIALVFARHREDTK